MIHNKWAQALILYIGGVIAWAAVNPAPPETSRTGVIVGQYMGAGLAMLAIGLIVALIPAAMYRFSEGKWPRWQIWLAAPFMVVFMFFAHVGMAEDGHATAAELTQYSNPDCDFVVEFPGEPSITAPSDQGPHIEQASLVVRDQDVYLRAECGRPHEPGLQQDWALNMSLFMKADGMEPISTDQERTTLDGVPVIVAEGSAHQRIGEIEAIVNMRVVASNASFLVLYAVQPTGGGLSPTAWQFLRAYSLAGDFDAVNRFQGIHSASTAGPG